MSPLVEFMLSSIISAIGGAFCYWCGKNMGTITERQRIVKLVQRYHDEVDNDYNILQIRDSILGRSLIKDFESKRVLH